MLLLFAVALTGFAAWPKTRYFSTSAPLIVFVLLMLLGIGMPHQGGIDFFRIALPFAYVFIAGVIADLLQTRWSELITAVVGGDTAGARSFQHSGLGKDVADHFGARVGDPSVSVPTERPPVVHFQKNQR